MTMKQKAQQARYEQFGNFLRLGRSLLGDFLKSFRGNTTYVFRVICPNCNKTRCDLIADNRFRCETCKCEFTFPEPRIESKSPTDQTSESVGDVAILIFSATQDWSGVREGETLSTVWERWSQESDVWYAVRKIENLNFSSSAQTSEAEHVLLVLSNVRNYKVFQRETLSRLAVERVLEENKENAVIERFARLSADDIATLDDDWSKP